MRKSNYETDFYGWANEQAAVLRAGRLDAADIAHIAEEIERMGRSEKRELINRLTVLLTHLLKGRHQPGGRGASWQASIKAQRFAIEDHLSDNPSLTPQMPEAIDQAFRAAALEAAVETKLLQSTFPNAREWSFEEIMNPDFWPE
jgi:hypothetical protein